MKSIRLIPELGVFSLKKSLDFYQGLLGFTILYQRQEENFAYIKLANAELMLDQIGSGRTWETGKLEYPLGRGVNFQIEVKDVDKLHQKLQAQNVPMFLPMEEKWYRKNDQLLGQKQFAIQDPDGYLLRFYEKIDKGDEVTI